MKYMKPFPFALSIFSLFVLLTSSECKKPKNDSPPDNPYGLPNATKEGKMVFACRVNGKNWISENGIYALKGIAGGDSLVVSGSFGKTNDFDHIGIRIINGTQTGTSYTIANNQDRQIRISSDQACNGDLLGFFRYFNATKGTVFLTRVDTVNRILSGTFLCTIPISGCDTLQITDGRFDIRY